MEQEKLNEAKKFLEEDREKFQKLMDDQKHEADEIVKKVRCCDGQKRSDPAVRGEK